MKSQIYVLPKGSSYLNGIEIVFLISNDFTLLKLQKIRFPSQLGERNFIADYTKKEVCEKDIMVD